MPDTKVDRKVAFTLRVSTKVHQELWEARQKTGLPINALIEIALERDLGKLVENLTRKS